MIFDNNFKKTLNLELILPTHESIHWRIKKKAAKYWVSLIFALIGKYCLKLIVSISFITWVKAKEITEYTGHNGTT